MARPEINTYSIPLTGKLVNSVDGMLIGKNYKSLVNLRYTDTNLRAVLGMTKINSTPVEHTSIVNGYHYLKPDESHLLVQGQATGYSSLYESTDAIPSTGTFSELYIEDNDALTGYFSHSPHGEMIYCNSAETLMWPGSSSDVSGFIITDSGDNFYYDYTEEVQNELEDDNNIAKIGGGGVSSIDSDTVLLLHLDNNVTDSSN